MSHADDAYAIKAANRLWTVVTAFFAITSTLAVAAVGIGLALVFTTHGVDRTAGIIAAASGVGTWLSALVPTLTLQALARYMVARCSAPQAYR